MSDYQNPFEYEAANNLPREMILDVYIEDYNYSRFVLSARNIVLKGARGSGKTMMLLYNSLPVQVIKSERARTNLDLSRAGIYVSCNSPLVYKQEWRLLDTFRASIISEHYLVLAIIYGLADALSAVPELIDAEENKRLAEELNVVLEWNLPGKDILVEIKQNVERELNRTQKHINDPHSDGFYSGAVTFSSSLISLVRALRRTSRLTNTHFLFMVDDAHDLNEHQLRALNSWIAFRDHTEFSFKVATARLTKDFFVTSSGSTNLETHDYTLVDLEHPFQNQDADFGKLARLVIESRLNRCGIVGVSVDEFFPVNQRFQEDLERCESEVRAEAIKRRPNATQKQINDRVYKYARARYFRERDPKANRPPYSGFNTIAHLSTGVIRNLLEPCYWMYESAYSDATGENGQRDLKSIPPSIQERTIMERSEKLWSRLRNELVQAVPGCTQEEADQVYNLFDNLAKLFRYRLLHHNSEPRAITFTISAMDGDLRIKLERLLAIAKEFQILYTRQGSAKDDGARTTYYVPSRMLWPARGLDPVGQHSQVSLTAKSLWEAANGKRFPELERVTHKRSLFDD